MSGIESDSPESDENVISHTYQSDSDGEETQKIKSTPQTPQQFQETDDEEKKPIPENEEGSSQKIKRKARIVSS